MLFPIVLLLGLNGLVVGILNAYDHFTIPALTPLVWNFVIIAFLVGARPLFHGDEQLYAYAIGVLVGTVGPVRDGAAGAATVGFHFEWSFDLHDPRVAQVLTLMLPVTLGLGLINFDLFINSTSARSSPTRRPRAIDAAFRIYMLPQGMFSVAIATVLFPPLSRLAARKDFDGLRAHRRQRPAPDLPAADPGGGRDARPRRADHAPGLPARRVRRRSTRARLDRAVLVLLQPAVQRRQPAADPHVLQPAAAVAADALRVGQPRREPQRLGRARQPFGIGGIVVGHGDRERGDDRRAGLLPAPRAGRPPGGARDDARRSIGMCSRPSWFGVGAWVGWAGAGLALRALAARPDHLGRRRADRRRRRSTRCVVLAMQVAEAEQMRRARRSRRLGRACAAAGRPPALSCAAVADQAHIRNFSIIAHIDHGKSTLADRILEMTKTVDARDMRAQVLDSMDLERERGITIKAQAVRVYYEARDGETYQLHLIDTPGHVDFTYEVCRSLAACEGALLVVDASQGVEAQTRRQHLPRGRGRARADPVPEQDRPARRRARARRRGGRRPARRAADDDPAASPARPARASSRCSSSSSSACRRPPATATRPPRALIFDSEFDQYRGVVAYIRVVDGVFTQGRGDPRDGRAAPRPTSTTSASSRRR